MAFLLSDTRIRASPSDNEGLVQTSFPVHLLDIAEVLARRVRGCVDKLDRNGVYICHVLRGLTAFRVVITPKACDGIHPVSDGVGFRLGAAIFRFFRRAGTYEIEGRSRCDCQIYHLMFSLKSMRYAPAFDFTPDPW